MGLDAILRHQFGDEKLESDSAEQDDDEMTGSNETDKDFSQDFSVFVGKTGRMFRIVTSGRFTGFFLLLTLYTFYVPDIDVIFGSKQSETVVSITMTVTMVLFLAELVVNSLAKPGYRLSFSFWLDFAASLSLLPETWMWKLLLSSNFIVATDESLTQYLMLVARSSRASRLQRLTRLMRIAALLPRLTSLFQRSNRQLEADARSLLDKKLHRIFAYLDTDYDGKISTHALNAVLQRFDSAQRKTVESNRSSVFQNLPFFRSKSSAGTASALPSTARTPICESDQEDEKDAPPEESPKVSPQKLRTDSLASDAMETAHVHSSKHLRFSEVTEISRPVLNDKSVEEDEATGVPLGHLEAPEKIIPRQVSKGSEDGSNSDSMADEDVSRNVSSISFVGVHSQKSDDLPVAERSMNHKNTKMSVSSWVSEVDTVTFDDFKEQILCEEDSERQLLSVCRNKLMKTSYMYSDRVKHMEDIGVKVALGVLFNILIVSLLSWSLEDNTAKYMCEMLDTRATLQFSDWNESYLPYQLQEDVLLWSQGLDDEPADRIPMRLIFLDVMQRTVCNELEEDRFLSCNESHANWPWPPRGSLQVVDEAFRNSVHRQNDVVLVRVPFDFEPLDSLGSLEVTSLALLDVRFLQEYNAWFSIIVTTTAIILIIVGIFAFTREISTLSTGLLRPIRLLADDMQSVTQMQLAGLSGDKAVAHFDKGVAEIRLMNSIFDKTKTAIRSWGKYVPWPVVQILLAAGIDSALKIGATEVTMFFSDIASFTTIVEKLPPERSLVLLSRYFNDMSQVIDSHGGIVIEFIGDAILSVFGAPLRNPQHAEACVKATWRMLKSLDRINAWAKNRELPHIGIRCGVHTGEVLVGNMGFHSRIKYGTMGENASIPSKLEELNKTYSTTNLVSEDTWLSMPAGSFVMRPLDYIYLRSTDPEPSIVYNILSAADDRGAKVERLEKMSRVYAEALANYRGQNFKKAGELFSKYMKASKTKTGTQDSAAKLMQKRCKFYQENPPPRDWDGVWDQAAEPP